MKEYKNGTYTGERALFASKDASFDNCLFKDGESPLKESSNLKINKTTFAWKYPLWYANNIKVNDSRLLITARSGIWYTHHIIMDNCNIEAPKTFRRSSYIALNNCTLDLPITELVAIICLLRLDSSTTSPSTIIICPIPDLTKDSTEYPPTPPKPLLINQLQGCVGRVGKNLKYHFLNDTIILFTIFFVFCNTSSFIQSSPKSNHRCGWVVIIIWSGPSVQAI